MASKTLLNQQIEVFRVDCVVISSYLLILNRQLILLSVFLVGQVEATLLPATEIEHELVHPAHDVVMEVCDSIDKRVEVTD